MICLAGGLVGAAGPAHAEASPVVYVKDATGCDDKGPGTFEVPLCDLNAAQSSDLVGPGTQVEVIGAQNKAPYVWTKSGTPDQPISITGVGASIGTGGDPVATPALTFSGVHDVGMSNIDVEGVAIAQSSDIRLGNETVRGLTKGVSVTGSQNVTIDHGTVTAVDEGVWIQDSTGTQVTGSQVYNVELYGAPTTTGDGVYVTGSGTTGTVINGDWISTTVGNGGAVVLTGGSSGTRVTRDEIDGEAVGWPGSDIAVKGSTGDSIIGNTVKEAKQDLTVTDGSTGLLVADNVFFDEKWAPLKETTVPVVSVDASSVPGTTLSHDIVYRVDTDSTNLAAGTAVVTDGLLGVPVSTGPGYSWAGKTYQDASGLEAATSQATNESSSDPDLEPYGYRLAPESPAIDSADSGVAGFQQQDYQTGDPLDDPYVANTGTGPVPYADRGALEYFGGPRLDATVKLESRPDPAGSGRTQYGVHIDLSGSSDPYNTIGAYTFFPEQGETTGTPAGAVADFWYCVQACEGSRYIDISVTDAADQSDARRVWMQIGPPAGSTPPPVNPPLVHRIGGYDRYQTADEAAQAQWTRGSADAVVLARGDLAPDALAGIPLAARVHGPLLLTDPRILGRDTRAEIDEALDGPGTHKTVYILGDAGAVDPSIETELRIAGYHVVRYAGNDRYGTALAVAASFGPTDHVLVATGADFPDALGAGPLGAAENAPVVLSHDGTLDPATAAFIARHKDIEAIGDQAVAAVGTLNTAGKTVTRLAGPDRFATARAVADQVVSVVGGPVRTLAVASGFAFPDALAGGSFAAGSGAPLLLTDPKSLSQPTLEDLRQDASSLRTVTLFGGSDVLSDDVMQQIVQAVRGAFG